MIIVFVFIAVVFIALSMAWFRAPASLGRRRAAPPVIGGRPLACLACGSSSFSEREAQLNTAVMTFFKLDWANTSATCLVCESCGYIHWFLPVSGR